MASYLFADIKYLSLKDQTSTCFFCMVCLFILRLSREITQPPPRRPVSSVGSVSKDVLTMMTDRDKSRAAQNKMRRHWVPGGICTNHVFLARLTAALIKFGVVFCPLDTMTKGSSFKLCIWRDFQVQKQRNKKMILS